MDDDEKPGRREALVSTSSDFNRHSVAKAQITKFQELQRKILQIKANSKKQKGSKESFGKHIKKNLGKKDVPSQDTEDHDLSIPQENSVCTAKEENLVANKKKQKLHWGLDVKERWERKANM